MRFAVESWAPEYGAPLGDEALAAGDAEASTTTDITVEAPAGSWVPRSPDPSTRPFDSLLFVDGVRRIEAHLWITGSDGDTRHGICASYAAGAVRCDGAAQLVAAEVRRGLFCATEGAAPVRTRHGDFDLHVAPDDDPVQLSLLLQSQMGALEREVARSAGGAGAKTDAAAGEAEATAAAGEAEATAAAGEAEIVVVDGPLKMGQERPGMVGYVKTHRQAYGEKIVRDVIGALAPGQRTPLLLIDTRRPRFSWYLRLPTQVTHSWAGVVRLETPADRPVAEVVELADRLTAALPAYASVPHKDPRAPQNLVPIGGLESVLRRRLGDPRILFRALQESANR